MDYERPTRVLEHNHPTSLEYNSGGFHGHIRGISEHKHGHIGGISEHEHEHIGGISEHKPGHNGEISEHKHGRAEGALALHLAGTKNSSVHKLYRVQYISHFST